MKLLINADDYGLTTGISKSIIDLFEHDAISDTSVMICVEGAVERCHLLKERGFSKKAGVHLQTTLERHHKKPLSFPDDIPSLVDSEGFFKSHECDDPIDPDDIELEWERQIVKLSEVLGHVPSHLDSHHGVHRIPHLLPVYLKLAAKYGMPVRGGRAPDQIKASSFGVKSTFVANGDWTGRHLPLSALQKIILAAMPAVGDGVFEIVSHPGYLDDDLIKSSSWNTVRENDYNELLALSKSNWLEDNNINLVCFSDL